ncbi:hypothetical protein QBC41DRAFT_316471 [Cercophora samala]|uniref:F-box domain-containing protein n=1 Tax=Cercophora samala TaxID=330535 RepID=A0AA39ZIB7_9PEZI|nr:hypothetical protein QBC41DRAFT_316471 [Cercophora samala]
MTSTHETASHHHPPPPPPLARRRETCPPSTTTTTTTTTDTAKMVGILSLPPEIFHNILANLDPGDLGSLPRVCKGFRDFVEGNNPLCRDIYLRILDKPPSTKGIDFVQELRDLLHLEQVTAADWLIPEDGDFNKPNRYARRELPFVYKTVTRLLSHIPSLDHQGPEEGSARLVNAETYHRSATCEFLARVLEGGPRSVYDENWNGAVDGYFYQSSIFKRIHKRPQGHFGHVSPKTVRRPVGEEVDEEERERRRMSAHLHCLLGIQDLLRDVTSGSSLKKWTLAERAYATACAKVYDIREYKREETAWGPFYTPGDGEKKEKKKGGLRVDWEKAEAIMIVLGTNLRAKGLAFFDAVEHVWGKRFGGVWEGSYIPWVPESALANLEKKKMEEEENADEDEEEREKRLELEELARRDPYGVKGTWLRVVCFLDYTDFFHFNFHNHGADGQAADAPREPLSTGEAVRLILMKVHVTKIEPADPEAGDHEDWPVVHFEGQSRALDWSWDGNADSDLKGTVRMTKEGEVRWTTYSIYDGEERWKSEGFQLGGRKSARGVIGNWFDKDYNEHGPCGPTAFWKVSDHEYDSNPDETGEMLNNLWPLLDNDDDSDAEEHEDSDENGSDSDEVDDEEEEEEDEDLDHELEEEDEAEEIEVIGGGLTIVEEGSRDVPGSDLPPGQGLRGGGVEDGGDDEEENQDGSESEAVGREYADIEPPSDVESNYDSDDRGPYDDGYDPYEEAEAYAQEMAQLPRYELNADYRRFNDMMAARFQIGMPEPDYDGDWEP